MRKIGKKAGMVAAIGTGVLVATSAVAFGAGELPEVPKPGDPKFEKFLADSCAETQGKVEGVQHYRYTREENPFPDFPRGFETWRYIAIQAEACHFKAEKDWMEPGVKKVFPGDWRSAYTRNCAQDPDAEIQKQYQDTRVNLVTTSFGFSANSQLQILKVINIGFQFNAGFDIQRGTWIWEGTTIKVPPGKVGWLESSQDIQAVRGDFTIKFPGPVRGKTEWSLDDVEIRVPSGQISITSRFRDLSDEEIRQYCDDWDWSAPDPRDNDNGNGGNGDNGNGNGNGGNGDGDDRKGREKEIEKGDGKGGGDVEPMNPVIQQWRAQKYYSLHEKVIFDGVVYECIRAHQADNGWEPSKTPELWRRL